MNNRDKQIKTVLEAMSQSFLTLWNTCKNQPNKKFVNEIKKWTGLDIQVIAPDDFTPATPSVSFLHEPIHGEINKFIKGYKTTNKKINKGRMIFHELSILVLVKGKYTAEQIRTLSARLFTCLFKNCPIRIKEFKIKANTLTLFHAMATALSTLTLTLFGNRKTHKAYKEWGTLGSIVLGTDAARLAITANPLKSLGLVLKLLADKNKCQGRLFEQADSLMVLKNSHMKRLYNAYNLSQLRQEHYFVEAKQMTFNILSAFPTDESGIGEIATPVNDKNKMDIIQTCLYYIAHTTPVEHDVKIPAIITESSGTLCSVRKLHNPDPTILRIKLSFFYYEFERPSFSIH